jgi:FUS-interacting serine-arginine-rich protein 1
MMHGDRGGAGPGSGNGSGPNPYGGGGGPGGGGGGPPPGERRRGRRDDTPQGVSLLVRNLSTDITSSDLQAAFRRIGEIKDVYIPLDYHSKLPKGFAFIEFATPDQARNARDEMNRFLMKGRELEVVYAQEKRKTPGEMRVRTDSPERGDDGGGDGGFERSYSFE